MFAASAADIATTEWGLSQGLHEANPAASQRGLRVATHVVGPAVVYWASERLIRDGKPKLALGLRVALMVAYSYAAIHNARLIQGSPGLPVDTSSKTYSRKSSGHCCTSLSDRGTLGETWNRCPSGVTS